MRITKKYNKSISGNLIGDIRRLIATARHNVAVTVNAGLTILYWQIGNRIRQDILKKRGRITNKEYQEWTNISRQTATIDLSEMVKKSVFERIGKAGKGIAYQLP